MLAPTTVAATTIVVLRTDDEVLLGADSQGFEVDAQAVRQVCKIQPAGRFFVACAGFTLDSSGFDAYRILSRAAALGRDVVSTSDEAAAQMKVELEKSLTRALRESPKELQSVIEAHNLPSFVVIGWDGGRPVASSRRAQVDVRRRTVAVSFTSYDMTAGKLCDSLGFRAEIERFASGATPEVFWSVPLDARVEGLITSEIDANPEWVGGPIDIVRIGSGESEWLRRKALCLPAEPTIAASETAKAPVGAQATEELPAPPPREPSLGFWEQVAAGLLVTLIAAAVVAAVSAVRRLWRFLRLWWAARRAGPPTIEKVTQRDLEGRPRDGGDRMGFPQRDRKARRRRRPAR